MTPTPTSGAADLRTAAQAVVDRWDTPLWKDVPATAEYIGRLRAALAAGQATAAQAVVQDDLITLRKPTTSAELLWLLKLAHLVISDVDKTLEETFAPAQPAAEASRFGSPELQAMIIARCVEKDQADSGFDYKTAADFLSGKTVSDEALRKFVAASRGAHDARAALHAKTLSLQGELASREAEIVLLKRSLLDAEAAPQPPTAQADSVLEDAAWMPLTPELLTAIESGDLGNRFWIAAHNSNEPQIGVYEWQQGRNPHGFNSDLSRYGASEITHVLPYKPPALPAALAAIKQGESHDR